MQAPDIIISDLDPKYHVPRDDIIMDETKLAIKQRSISLCETVYLKMINCFVCTFFLEFD